MNSEEPNHARRRAPPPLPLFASRTQARLLTRLFLADEDDGVPMSTLAQEFGVAGSTLHEEANRLERAGLIVSRRLGRSRILRANPDSPLYPELRALLQKAFGPATALTASIRGLGGVEEAFIHGSWAARYAGQHGPVPHDIDVVVIGSPDPDAVYDAVERVERELGRQINVTILSRSEWDRELGFQETVRARPIVRLAVGDDG